MPRRTVVIALLALVSVGLLSIRPVISITDKEAATLEKRITGLEKAITGLREDLSKKDENRKEGALKLVEQQARHYYELIKVTSEGTRVLFFIMLSIFAIVVAVVGIFVPFMQRRRFSENIERVRDFESRARLSFQDAKEFRDKTEAYMEKAEGIVGELEKRKTEIDEDINERVRVAVKEMDKRKEQTARFNQLFSEASREHDDGNYDAALRALDGALDIYDKSASAWSNKGILLDKLGKEDESIQAHQRSIQLDPDYAVGWFNLGVTLYATGRSLEDALEAYDKATQLNPKYGNAWHNKGATLMKLGRYEDSLKAYDNALELEPMDDDTWYLKARAYSKLGQEQKMLSALKKAIEFNPENKEVAQTDEDFDPFRDDEDFRAIVYGEEK